MRESSDSFESVPKNWFIRQKKKWKKSHADSVWCKLEKDVLPWIGKKRINTVTPKQMLTVLRRIEDRGVYETAHKTKQICSQIFTSAIVEGKVERN